MKETNIEKFKGSYEYVWWTIGGGIAFFGIIIYGQGFDDNVIRGLLSYPVIVIFIYLVAILTFVRIKDKKVLVSKVGFGRGFKTNIQDIIKIDRTSVFIFKTWGSRLQIHHLDESGQETWHTIQESMYSVKTIKQLLKRLKELNPSIELHPQYQALIDGKLSRDDEDYFKKLPIKGE